ncbi:hypothetical protein [Phyllobacterium endophyticum]|uniref:hypothetical protein n=1 Tax=Phyllobacterium endophyticum TaxID=1149773 RepID=UPI0011CC1CB8|nr:hypothetical protein [Phyllobacterium endophyticum]TXR49449.1 hypothetical protein FVA77_08960 [Phyllobacterium endophyticum]
MPFEEQLVRRQFLLLLYCAVACFLVGFVIFINFLSSNGLNGGTLNGVLFQYRHPGALFLRFFVWFLFLALGSVFILRNNTARFDALVDKPYERFRDVYIARIVCLTGIVISAGFLVLVIDVGCAWLVK